MEQGNRIVDDLTAADFRNGSGSFGVRYVGAFIGAVNLQDDYLLRLKYACSWLADQKSGGQECRAIQLSSHS